MMGSSVWGLPVPLVAVLLLLVAVPIGCAAAMVLLCLARPHATLTEVSRSLATVLRAMPRPNGRRRDTGPQKR